jgi:hypothetical protein
MTQRTLSTSRANARTPWESYFVLAAVTVLSALAVADRFAAWLIGEFPTSATLWQLRFEYLRPIGVYYDLVTTNLVYLSPVQFCCLMLLASVVIAAGVISRIRLLRALACHVVCGLALVLWVYSREFHEGLYAPAGAPSTLYVLIGAAVALFAGTLCLGVHAEYLGWNPGTSAVVRRSRIALVRTRRRLDMAMADLLDRLGAAPKPERIALASLRIVERPRSKR